MKEYRSSSPSTLFQKWPPGDWSPNAPSPIPFGAFTPKKNRSRDRHRSLSPSMATPAFDPTVDHGPIDQDDQTESRLQLFARDTTIHGIGQILRDDQPVCTRVIWIVAFSIAAIACFGMIGKSLVRYLEYTTKTTTALKTEDMINFPAITICNENLFAKSLMGSSPNTIASTTVIIATNMQDIHSKIAQAQRTCKHGPSEYTYRLNHDSYAWFQLIGVTKAMDIFAMDSKRNLIKCWWQDRATNCSRYFLNHMTDFGWCFTLNPSPTLLQGFNLSKPVSDNEWDISRTDTGYGLEHDYKMLQLRSTGPNNGFKMLLHVHQDEYCVTRTDSAGYKVLIHDPDVQPMYFLERPLALAPGFETSVAIRYTRQIKETSDLGRCVDGQELRLFPHGQAYYKEACYLECYTEFIYKNCNCTPLYGPPRSNYKMAELENLPEVRVCWDGDSPVCMKRKEREFLEQGLLHILCSHCKDPCNFTIYDLQISTAYFPAHNFQYLYEDVLNKAGIKNATQNDQESYIRKNLVLTNFYVESMQINEITETHGFTSEQFISEVGGQVGFFLGMSLLSLLEFLQCLLPRRQKQVRKKLEKPNPEYLATRRNTEHRKRY